MKKRYADFAPKDGRWWAARRIHKVNPNHESKYTYCGIDLMSPDPELYGVTRVWSKGDDAQITCSGCKVIIGFESQ